MTPPSDKKKKPDNSVNYGYLSQGMKGKFSAHNTCTLCSRVQVKLASLWVWEFFVERLFLIFLSHFCFSFRFCPKSTGEAPRAWLPPRKKSPGSTEYGKSWFGISGSRPAERFQYTSALLRAAVVWGGHASIQKETQDQKVNRWPCGTWAGKTFESKAQAVDYWWALGLEWWRRAFRSPQSGTPSPKCQVSEIEEICD